MKFLKEYRIYSNLVFVFPIVIGIYRHQLIFSALSLLVFLSSLYYHFVLVKTPDNRNIPRAIDTTIAFACYLYLAYYISYYKDPALQVYLFTGLLATVLVFVIGKYRKSEAIHALFHIFIAFVAVVIMLL